MFAKHLLLPQLLENTPTIFYFLSLFSAFFSCLVARACFWPHTVCSMEFYFLLSHDILQSTVYVYSLTFKLFVTKIYIIKNTLSMWYKAPVLFRDRHGLWRQTELRLVPHTACEMHCFTSLEFTFFLHEVVSSFLP